MIWLGIDPGKHGAIAVIDGSDVCIHPIPLITATKGKGRDEYDLVGIRDLIEDLAQRVSRHPANRESIFVTVERSQAFPAKMRGGIANYHRGVARGWEWMLVALRIPYQLVAPATWMRLMHAGTPGQDTKQRSKIAAQRLFPEVNLKRTDRSRVVDHNLCEALLIAEFGRRIQGGGSR